MEGPYVGNSIFNFKTNGGVFDIQKLERRQLICDMEDKSNWYKMVKPQFPMLKSIYNLLRYFVFITNSFRISEEQSDTILNWKR